MLIAISGKIESGKDTIGKIIQGLYLRNTPEMIIRNLQNPYFHRYIAGFEIKKFADQLKEMVCEMIGCTRDQLEDRIFKNTPLPKEWWYYTIGLSKFPFISEELMYKHSPSATLVRLTPRDLFLGLGTGCGREIHPNIWINTLFKDFISEVGIIERQVKAIRIGDRFNTGRQINIPQEMWDLDIPSSYFRWAENIPEDKLSKWIITDLRFPNELEEVKRRKGITIRVERPFYYNLMEDGTHEFFDKLDKSGHVYRMNSSYPKEEAERLFIKDFNSKAHISETALDNAEFDYTIINDTSLEDLIHTVKLILTKEKII